MITADQIEGKRLLIRCDFNVPMEHGSIISDTRIRACLPTLQLALDANASLLLVSHLGRPQSDSDHTAYTLAPIAQHLSNLLNRPVPLLSDWIKHPPELKPGDVALLENIRFLEGETANDPTLCQQLASLCDVFIMDAFACAHREHASTYGLAHYALRTYLGPLFEQEIQALQTCYASPSHPMLALIGGAKGATKIKTLASLIPTSDVLILGGGIANTFLAAKGMPIGLSIHDPDQIEPAKQLIALAGEHATQLILPQDVIVQGDHGTQTKPCAQVAANDKIVDIGPASCQQITALIQSAQTLLWNGPFGWYEHPPFDQGTQKIALAVAASHAYSVVGGGDTLTAVEACQVTDQISYLSTGGGACLAYLQHHTLPIINLLKQRTVKIDS